MFLLALSSFRQPLRSTGITLLHHYYGLFRLPLPISCLSLAVFELVRDYLSFTMYQMIHGCAFIPPPFLPRNEEWISQVPDRHLQNRAVDSDPGRALVHSPLPVLCVTSSSPTRILLSPYMQKVSLYDYILFQGSIPSLTLRPGLSFPLASHMSLPRICGGFRTTLLVRL